MGLPGCQGRHRDLASQPRAQPVVGRERHLAIGAISRSARRIGAVHARVWTGGRFFALV
jgi:hypothetical protein